MPSMTEVFAKKKIPDELLQLRRSAQGLSRKAKTPAQHKAAMKVHNLLGQKAIKLGFDDFGDEHKGWAHD